MEKECGNCQLYQGALSIGRPDIYCAVKKLVEEIGVRNMNTKPPKGFYCSAYREYQFKHSGVFVEKNKEVTK